MELVEAVSGSCHAVLHPVQEAVIHTSCHTGRGGGGHHWPPPLPPEVETAAMVTVAGVLGAVVPLGCRLSGIAGQRG